MNRTLATKRLFSLGNYSNIEFSHTITEIPEKIALDPKAMELLSYVLLLDIEYAYKRYHLLIEQVNTKNLSEVIEFIETERQDTFSELLAKYNN